MAVPGERFKHNQITDSIYVVKSIRDGYITIQREGEASITLRIEEFNKNYKRV